MIAWFRSDGANGGCGTPFFSTGPPDDRGVTLAHERQPGQARYRLSVVQQAQQNRGHRRSGGVVEGPVDRIEHPDPWRVEVGSTELLAVHGDPGCRHQRVHHLALDGQVDLGGEIVAPLADRGIRAMTDDERLCGGIQDRRRLVH